jgi:serine/threonine protein kinase
MPTKCPTCHAENPDDKQFCGDCGTKLDISPDAPPSVTKTLDLPIRGLEKGSIFAERYEIIELLGEGGMGQVYRAHDTQIEEDIAIKVLRPDIALSLFILLRSRNLKDTRNFV